MLDWRSYNCCGLGCFTCTAVLPLLQLVMYGIDGGVQAPAAVPFDDSVLGRKLQSWLEYILMPGGTAIPAQFVVDAVAAGRVATMAGAFDEAIEAGYTQELVHILQRVSSLIKY